MSAKQTTVDTCLAILKATGYPLAAVTSNSDSHGHDHGSGGDSHGHDHGNGGDSHGHDHGEDDHEHSHGFCSGVEGHYSVGLHIAAIFVILVASAVGTLIPILGKRVPALRMPPFVYCVGKCISIGVMMAVALIHMISHASAAFEADCIPVSFSSKFEGWAFLFAMIAAIVMHFIDHVAADVATGWMERQEDNNRAKDGSFNQDGSRNGDPQGYNHAKCTPTTCLEDPLEERCGAAAGNQDEPVSVEMDRANAGIANNAPDCERDDHSLRGDDAGAMACAGHQHGAVVPEDIPRFQRVIAALCMEFGVTLHSVFVGLTLGVTANDDLRVLLIALVFHQMFEGLAMGARLADAEMKITIELALMLIFSFSAPVGIAAGTGAVSASRNALSGTSYAMVSGIMDSICGGILLYLSFNLLFIDFPADVRRYCPRHAKGRVWRMALMFLGLWVGAGVMALIGKWL